MADYDIGQAFRGIEHELIGSMTRNLGRHRAEETELGYNWAQWQVVQIQELERYRTRNIDKFGNDFNEINSELRQALQDSYNTGATKQERRILQNVRRMQKGTGTNLPAYSGTAQISGEFFTVNDRKLDALLRATTNDMQKAEYAVLRHANDQYRKIIFNAQVYANTGAGTYEKALDMACRDFLSSGINCIQYKNGRMVPIDVYAEMALRTASKRAYLQGEGEMRKKWGIHTVILNKRTNACPKCAPFCGKVIVDDVWSGGTPQEAEEHGYLLMSECIKDGLYHPNCKDSHTTYFGDFLDDEEDEQYPPEDEDDDGEPRYTASELLQPVTDEERQLSEQLYDAEQRENHCERQVRRFERLSEFSFDEDNRRAYGARLKLWETRDKEALFDIDETKKKIKEVQEKAAKPRASHLLWSGGTLTRVDLSFNSNDEKESENSTPESVENSGESGIIDEAKAIDSMFYADDYEYQTYTKEEIIEHLKTSPVGLDTLRYLEENPQVKVMLSENRKVAERGEHKNDLLTIWLNNCPNVRVAAQTVVHEVTHHKYNIGGSQLAETICFAYEKMHKEGRNYITREEWNNLVNLVKDAYWNFPSEGGVDDIGRFKNVIKDG